MPQEDKAKMANHIGGNILFARSVRQMGAEFRRTQRPNLALIVDYRCRQHDCTDLVTLRGEVMAVAIARKITLR